MKFQNENSKFEWEVLGLNENEYIKKIKLLKPFQEDNDIFEYENARDKWNNSTKQKRFKTKINYCLKILNNNKYIYSDVIEIFKTLSSISTHLFIELEYYETDRQKLKEFLKITDIFLNKYNKVIKEFSKIIIKPELLNNYKKELQEIFNYFKDF